MRIFNPVLRLTAFTVALFFWLLHGKANAQQRPTLLFKHLTLENGLSDPNVQAMYADRYGFLWLGTENGLNRFDGANCIAYKNESQTKHFPGNYITNIIGDKEGNLIIGSQRNLVKYNQQSDRFERYPLKKGLNFTDNYYAFPFYIDKQDELWVYLAGNVYRYKQKDSSATYVTAYSNGYQFYPGAFYKKLTSFISRGVKGIYITIKNKNNQDYTREYFSDNSKQNISTYISDVYKANDSLLWLASDRGLIKLNTRTEKYELFDSFELNKNLMATAIARHPQQPWLFVGTRNHGLLLFNLTNQKYFAQYTHLPDQANSLTANSIKKIFIDKKQNLFLSIAGHGIDYTNLNKVIFSGRVDKFSVPYPNFQNDISITLKLTNGNIWCGTKTSGLLCYNSDLTKLISYDFAQVGIAHLTELNNHDVLVGLANGSFFIYDHLQKLFKLLKNTQTNISPGKLKINQIVNCDGNLFAAAENGLFRIFISAGKNLSFEPELQFNRSLPWSNVQTIIPVSSSLFLIQTYYTTLFLAATNGKQVRLIRTLFRTPFGINGILRKENTLLMATTSGLLSLDLKSMKLDQKPIIDAYCTSIISDKYHNLWIGTNNGLYIHNSDHRKTHRYTISDGLQSMVFSPYSASVLENGQVAFGGLNGISLIDPEKSSVYNNPAKPKIISVLVNDQELPGIDNPVTLSNLKLEHHQNTLTFVFSTMDFIDPQHRKMMYQMVGYDDKKVETTGSGIIRFPNLPPGNFKLILADVYSNQKTVLCITISAPFWQKTWFIAVCILSATAITLIVFYLYLRWLKHMQALQLRQMINFQKADRKRIADDLHDDLGLKLSSLKHYLLAGDINKMIDSGELRKLSVDYIDASVAVLKNTLTSLSPKTLDENGLITALTDLTQEINNLKIIEVFLDYSGFTVELKTTVQYALYRICQELINNTIKHAGAKNIYVVLINRQDKVIFLYEDDGKGYDYHAVERGYGLFNIEAYAKAIKAELNIDSSAGKGLAVTITLNLKQTLRRKNHD